jgi:hypothetical protein
MMSEEEQALVREMVIREGIALLVMAGVIWYMGPGKIVISGLVHRARVMAGTRSTAIDVEVQQFSSEVSRWEHEQAAKKDRRAGRGGPCGCG